MSKKGTDLKPALAIALMVVASPAAALDIVTRNEWAAKLPLFEMASQEPVRITIHHTGTPRRPAKSIEQKLRSLQAFSQSNDKLADGRRKKAWADVPYHFYVDALGQVAEGRDVNSVGDTNTNYDPTGHIAVVVEGNFEVEIPSEDQKQALMELLRELTARHGIPVENTGHHGTFASTLCPGINLTKELPDILAAIK